MHRVHVRGRIVPDVFAPAVHEHASSYRRRGQGFFARGKGIGRVVRHV